MNWNQYRDDLSEGRQVQCRPKGNSMLPRIKSGQLLTIDPDISSLKVGDIVFCKVNGHFYTHLLTAIGKDGRYQISNNHNHINGWTKAIYGKVIKIED